MTLLYASETFLDHLTGPHPERPERIASIQRMLDASGLAARCTRPDWQPAGLAALEAVHEPTYLATVEAFAMQGGGRLEADTVLGGASWDVAQLAAGAVCDAVDRVLQGQDRTAFCAIRPPGHHALPAAAMGFCLVNNVAVAARWALSQHRVNRVLVVDWDVHHGNGTQDIFYADEQVGFFSIHRWPFYPGTGDASETGTGAGLGTTRNCPVTYGTPRSAYLEQFSAGLEDLAGRLRPELVLLSAGFDAHVHDPIGSLDLETEDFAELTRRVAAIAADCCQGRLVSVLEGGYNVDALAASVQRHLEVLLDGA